jgi:putative Holliday junction resolvase
VGIDLGTKRIGIAVCDQDQRVATAATTILRCGDVAADHRAIAELVGEYGAVGVVVGLPKSLAGGLGAAGAASVEEADRLAEVLGVPVATIDERFTTVSAQQALRRGGYRSRRQRQVVDQVAAAVLLQSWLDRRGRTGDRAW